MTGPLGVLFLPRYDVLRSYYIEGIWRTVTPEQMRVRPDPRVNSIAWNLWHLARVEDAGVNRMLVDGTQVFDERGWGTALGLPWRHQGSGMTLDEVDEFDRLIDLEALHGYMVMVQERTRAVALAIDSGSLASDRGTPALEYLDVSVSEGLLRKVVLDEGLARSDGERLVANYMGWTRAKCLTHFALTHPFQHVGEMDVIAGLLGIEF